MVVNKALRSQIHAAQGDTVEVELTRDTSTRTVTLPGDFRGTLKKDKAANAQFAKLPLSHQKAYLEYVTEAKRPETRKRRIEEMIKKLKE